MDQERVKALLAQSLREAILLRTLDPNDRFEVLLRDVVGPRPPLTGVFPTRDQIQEDYRINRLERNKRSRLRRGEKILNGDDSYLDLVTFASLAYSHCFYPAMPAEVQEGIITLMKQACSWSRGWMITQKFYGLERTDVLPCPIEEIEKIYSGMYTGERIRQYIAESIQDIRASEHISLIRVLSGRRVPLSTPVAV